MQRLGRHQVIMDRQDDEPNRTTPKRLPEDSLFVLLDQKRRVLYNNYNTLKKGRNPNRQIGARMM